MRRVLYVLCLLTSVLWAAAARAAEPADLAPDLAYLRVQSVTLDREAIAAALARPRALVLDLRYPFDERGVGENLRQLLDGAPGPARLYILVSPATPVPVVGAIAANPVRWITLGVKGSRPEPQVVVLQSAEDDKKAYASLLAGTTPADLIAGRIEKERFDEASLVKEFKNGNHNAPPALRGSESGGGSRVEGPPAPGGTAPSPTKPSATSTPPAGEPPPKLVDRVLQRTVHLHRALQALKR